MLKKVVFIGLCTTLLVGCSKPQTTQPDTKPVSEKKEQTYKTDESTMVLLDDDDIQADDIVKIIKHGDHWHVFTKDGKEHITYTDPSTLQSGQGLSLVSVVSLQQLKNLDVVEIKVHENHWHVFTSDGMEYLTYENPSSLFQNLTITQYQGHHTTLLNQSNNQKPDIQVVKILQHGDHWHIYTNTGAEYVVYSDPRAAYPNAFYGIYEGSHDQHPTPSTTQELPLPGNLGPVVQVKTLKDILGRNVTRIIDHGDHYHVYEGDVEIAVIHEDPKPYFPNAEYIKEETHGDIHVDQDEVFTYESVEEKLDENIIPALTNNIKSMDHYGHVNDGIPVYGTDDKAGNYFYWLHNGNHYHALSIKDLIKLEKAGELGGYSARDVVAFLKYKINHNYQVVEELDSELEQYAKVEFLKNYYHLDEGDYYVLGNNFEIQLTDPYIVIPFSSLSVENGTVTIRKQLPEFTKETLEAEEENEQLSEEELAYQEEKRKQQELFKQKLAQRQQIEKTWSKKYGMDQEEFAERFYDIADENELDCDITDVEFHDDFTFTYDGNTYSFTI